MQTMDDGVSLAYTLYTPDGAAPTGGWPGVVVLHGLGGTRGSVAEISTGFADAGYAVLAYDARGHGASGGVVTLAGPREVADLRAVRNAFAARPNVSDTKIGAWGISYGGGQIWNALAAGVPFAAAEVVETWTSLYDALWPQNLARSGIVAGFATSVAARSPLIAGLRDAAVQSTDPAAIRQLTTERSALAKAGSIRTPMYLFQGRVDFAFDISQATRAYARLAGPKRLYVGTFGHPPSTFPGPDIAFVRSEGRAWFDAYLKGAGADLKPQVTIGSQNGRKTTFAAPAEDADADVHARGPLRAQRRRRRHPPDRAAPRGARELGRRHSDRHRSEACELSATRRQRPRRPESHCPRGSAPEGRRQPSHACELLRLRPTRRAPPRERRRSVAGRTVRLPGVPGLRLGDDRADHAQALNAGETRLRMKRVALLLGLVLASTAGAAATADPGVTAKKIVLGGTVPLSGEASAFGSVGPGAKAYFAYVNAKGGVHGRKIDYRFYDDAYDPVKTVQQTRRLVEQDKVFAIFNSVGTANNKAIQPYLNQRKVPQLFVGDGAQATSQPARYPWTMGFLQSYVGEGAVYGRNLAKTRKGAKIGVLFQNDDLGRDMTKGLERAIAGKGPQIVAKESYEYTDTDVSSQIASLKAAGADTFMLFATPKFAIQGFAAANKLGWKPQVYVASVSIEPNIMAIARLNAPQLTNGALSVAFVKNPNDPIWAKDPALKLYRTIMKRYLPSGKPSDVYNWYGMTVAWTMVETLERAGKNPTRASLLRAAQTLNVSNNPFLLPGIALKTSRTRYFPLDKVYLYRFDNRQWVKASPLLDARG